MQSNKKSWLKELPDGSCTVTEGSAEMLFDKDSVFYNPIQEFNRDMSIAAIKSWSELFLEEKRTKNKKKAVVVKSDLYAGREPDLTLKLKEKRKQDLANFQKVLASEDDYKYEEIDVKSTDYDGYSFTVMEAFAASGLRSIRYAKEIPRISEILTNDLMASAVESIGKNAVFNKVDHIIVPNQGDACQTFYKALAEGVKYDVVDLDPYGSAAPFLDAAVQCVSDGGLLCVTCTDLSVLAGSQPESCFGKYGSVNIPNSPYTHEMALRILLYSIQSTAAKYKLAIEVLQSCSIDYYVRVFVRVWNSPLRMKEASSKTGMLITCLRCNCFEIQIIGKLVKTEKGFKYGPAQVSVEPLCLNCGQKNHVGGPIYADKIHSKNFVSRMIGNVVKQPNNYGTWDRMIGMLMVIFEELEDHPLYYDFSKLCNVVHASTFAFPTYIGAIQKAGYKVSQSHCSKNSVKTDAPEHIIWDAIRCWTKTHPVNDKRGDKTPGAIILAKETKYLLFNVQD
jgi:tRNA (guanine26-N2/guanine27-N2)-dimethyltransferase